MPAVRTVPRDVLIRVPKVEPYSNSYVPPSVRAKEEAKKAAEAQGGTLASATAEASSSTINSADPLNANATTATAPPAADALGTTAIASADAATTTTATTTTLAEATATTTAGQSAADTNKSAEGSELKDRRERGNSPTLPFLSVDREEEQTVELSKAATSSAGWNSLLVWARRQRGAQWDESTALWQVDKYSREYYSFCEDPATTDRSKQPGDEKSASTNKESNEEAGKEGAAGEEDDDKGPIRISSRNKTEGDAVTGSPPPVAMGRSARLLRR